MKEARREYIKTMMENLTKRNECFDAPLTVGDDVSLVTQLAVNDWNRMSNEEFFAAYGCTKYTYKRRVEEYGDPYMNSPLAILGKQLAGMEP